MRNRVNWKFFVLNIGIVFVILLCSAIDNVNDKAVSILEVLLKGHEAVRLRTTWSEAFHVVLYGNLDLALPPLATIATLPLFCDEMRNGNYLFHISRVGAKKYIHQKYLAAVCSCAGILFAGMAAFCIFLFCTFPSVHDFGNSQVIGLVELTGWEMLLDVSKYGAYVICWGGMLAAFSCLLVGLTQNIYLVLSIPFLANYVVCPYLRNWNLIVILFFFVFFYKAGYRLWLWKQQGVRT